MNKLFIILCLLLSACTVRCGPEGKKAASVCRALWFEARSDVPPPSKWPATEYIRKCCEAVADFETDSREYNACVTEMYGATLSKNK